MANILRYQDCVPDVYPRKSRDFQLLCNLFDCVQGGVKYDIDSIIDILDASQCNERVLPLLQTKLGFFSNKHITGEQLRVVLQGFAYIVRNKGSLEGIRAAIEVFLKLSSLSTKGEVSYTNIDKSTKHDVSLTRLHDSYRVDVFIEAKVVDTTVLTEILNYVLPAGYRLRYTFKPQLFNESYVDYADTIHIVFASREYNDAIRSEDTFNSDELSVQSIGTSTVLSQDDLGDDVDIRYHSADIPEIDTEESE